MTYRLALASATICLLTACSLRSSLPIYGRVPDFELTRETGQHFNRTDIAGSVWIANFIFTTCTGPCPRMTSQMKQIQDALYDRDGITLVSLTIDPEHDTPAVLTAYGRRFKADPAHWLFLTGDRSELQKLSKDTFFLGDIGPPFEHSTRFVLIDKQERIRGFYDSSDQEAIHDLVRHAEELRHEKM